MSVLKEFREFAVNGNVLDLAVGVIIGGAFGKIVSSLVDDLLMPVLGLATGKVDFSSMFYSLDGQTYANLKAARDAKAPAFAYGLFINNVIQFVIVAFAIFMIVKAVNKMRAKPAPAPDAAPAAPTTSEALLMEIRDSLKSGK